MSFSYQGQRVRRSTETSDKRLADSILATVKVKIIEGRFFGTLQEKERTFGEMMDRYVKECSSTKAPASAVRDQNCLQHLLPCFGTKSLAEITPRGLADYKVLRRNELAAPGTINKELALVRHAFNVAIREWEWCRENPMQKVRLERVHNEIDRWLASEEEARLLAAAPDWLREIIVFALNTGMRRGEILALRWRDVDFHRGTLVVMHSKNRERRTIPLNNTVFELLATKQAVNGLKTELVFTTACGTMIKGPNLVHAFIKARERAGIENFRFHDLRHTFATRLVQKGVDTYKVQRLLGHKTAAMTQRYAHHSPESLRGGVELLDHGGSVGTNLAQSRGASRDSEA
jgi:integrase